MTVLPAAVCRASMTLCRKSVTGTTLVGPVLASLRDSAVYVDAVNPRHVRELADDSSVGCFGLFPSTGTVGHMLGFATLLAAIRYTPQRC